MEEENSCNGFNLIFQISKTVPKFWDIGFLLRLLKVIFLLLFLYILDKQIMETERWDSN